MKRLSPAEPRVDRRVVQICLNIRIEIKRQYPVSYIKHVFEKQGFHVDIADLYTLRIGKCIAISEANQIISRIKDILVSISNRISMICAETYIRVKDNLCENSVFQRIIHSNNNTLSGTNINDNLVLCVYNSRKNRSIIRIIPRLGNKIEQLDLLLIPRTIYISCGDVAIAASYLTETSRLLIQVFREIIEKSKMMNALSKDHEGMK